MAPDAPHPIPNAPSLNSESPLVEKTPRGPSTDSRQSVQPTGQTMGSPLVRFSVLIILTV